MISPDGLYKLFYPIVSTKNDIDGADNMVAFIRELVETGVWPDAGKFNGREISARPRYSSI